MKGFILLILLFYPLAFGMAGCGGGGNDDYADRMAEEHAGDEPEATAIVQEPILPVRAQEATYGESYRGFTAVPERPDSVAQQRGLAPGDTALPAIIVIHEWWGLNDNVRAMARRLAGEGYRTLAVDLYNGQVAQDPQQARQLVTQARQNRVAAVDNLTAAYRHLKENHRAPAVGVIGWCFGGGMALETALALPDELDAAVMYYGQPILDQDRLSELQMPILGIFGEKDQGIPVDTVRAFESALQELGKNATFHYYDADHAFANPSGGNYDAEAAEDAWDKTVAFFREHLYPTAPM